MNENSGKKRREWVKNAAIIFLSVMLVLTFFSNKFPSAFPSEISRSDLLIILLILPKRSMLIVAVPLNDRF